MGQTCAKDGPKAGTCAPAAFTNFLPGPALKDLPSCMQTAINNSMAGKQTAADDANMTGLGQPIIGNPSCGGKSIIPYCQQAAYANTIYCACQNSGMSNPVCVFAQCQNSPAAYRTASQQAVAADPVSKCPQQNVCISTTSVGGSGNVVQANQSSSCGGTVQKIMQNIKLHPAIAVLIIALVIVLAVLIASPSPKMKTLPPGGLGDDAGGIDGLPALSAV